jgi:hypothetical protein
MAVEDWPAGGPAGGGSSSWINWVGRVSLPLLYGLLAWVICDRRLKESRTWTCNTAMLRMLVPSVLVPLAPAVGRLVLETLLK